MFCTEVVLTQDLQPITLTNTSRTSENTAVAWRDLQEKQLLHVPGDLYLDKQPKIVKDLAKLTHLTAHCITNTCLGVYLCVTDQSHC